VPPAGNQGKGRSHTTLRRVGVLSVLRDFLCDLCGSKLLTAKHAKKGRKGRKEEQGANRKLHPARLESL